MHTFSLSELWSNMGWVARLVVIVLGGMSMYSGWVMLDRFTAVLRARRISRSFVLALRRALGARDLRSAAAAATTHAGSPVAKVGAAAFEELRLESDAAAGAPRRSTEGSADLADALLRAVERTREREVADLRRGLGALASISSSAPFVGLFGTVVGIINAFRSMAASGQGGLGAVSGGIAEALFTTAAGLLVAIPAVMTFNYLTGAIDRLTVDINDVASELVSFLLREGPGGERRV